MIKNPWLTLPCLFFFLVTVVSCFPLTVTAAKTSEACWGRKDSLKIGCCSKYNSCSDLGLGPKTSTKYEFDTSCKQANKNGVADYPNAVCCLGPTAGSWCNDDVEPSPAPQTPPDTPLVTSPGPEAKARELPKFSSLIKVDIQVVIGNIIKGLLGLTGTVTVIMMVYGGLLWMTASGNDKAVGQAKQIILWTAIGLILVFFSYTILKFLFESLKI